MSKSTERKVNAEERGETRNQYECATYLFSLLLSSAVARVQRIPEAVGQLPQWPLLRLPLHCKNIRKRVGFSGSQLNPRSGKV
jgi:hypothetical protein